jgi:hypothetical protein
LAIDTAPFDTLCLGELVQIDGREHRRVERAHLTLQDRLVKELQGISTIGAANAFMPVYMADYNSRFAKVPREVRYCGDAMMACEAAANR